MKKTKNDRPCNVSPHKKEAAKVEAKPVKPSSSRRIPLPVGVGDSGISLGGGDPINTDDTRGGYSETIRSPFTYGEGADED